MFLQEIHTFFCAPLACAALFALRFAGAVGYVKKL